MWDVDEIGNSGIGNNSARDREGQRNSWVENNKVNDRVGQGEKARMELLTTKILHSSSLSKPDWCL